jgi:PAS domain S-box-containing protein
MGEDVEAAAVHAGDPAGVYRYDVVADAWWWSDEVFAMHGLTPGEVTPTTKLLLEHQHPDDRESARALLEGCLSDGEPYSCYHRIVAVDGRVHRVVVVGDGERDTDGRMVAVRGFFVDVTEAVNAEIRQIADETIGAARESQENVDLARGIVMGVYGVDADTARVILRRHSQHTNTRLRDIAASLVAAAPAPPGSLHTELRRRLERAFYPG